MFREITENINRFMQPLIYDESLINQTNMEYFHMKKLGICGLFLAASVIVPAQAGDGNALHTTHRPSPIDRQKVTIPMAVHAEPENPVQ